jgi:ATP-dependent DNA ligase
VFSLLQAAMGEGRADQFVFFAFDLLFLNGQSTAQLPLVERTSRNAQTRRGVWQLAEAFRFCAVPGELQLPSRG